MAGQQIVHVAVSPPVGVRDGNLGDAKVHLKLCQGPIEAASVGLAAQSSLQSQAAGGQCSLFEQDLVHLLGLHGEPAVQIVLHIVLGQVSIVGRQRIEVGHQVQRDKDRLFAQELAVQHLALDGQFILPIPGQTQFATVVVVGQGEILATQGPPQRWQFHILG